MFDLATVEALTPFDFQNCIIPESEHGFLIHSVRMDCNYCRDNFAISRDASYPYFTLHVLFSGCCVFQTAGKKHLLKAGDVFLITAGQEHQYRNDQDSRLGFMWIELAGKGCKELLRYLTLNGIHCIDAQYSEKIADQLIAILQYVKDTPAPDIFTLSAMQYTLIMYLLEAARAQPKQNASPLVSAAIEQLDTNFTTTLQIQDIAKQLHVSHTYLTRQFKAQVGVSPMQYLHAKRIEYACHLLDNTALSCAQVAIEAGFYDATHFQRAFRKRMQCTPLKYRAREKR